MTVSTRRWARVGLFLVLLVALAVFVNAYVVDRKTRAAVSRDGGTVVDTTVLSANVRVEGDGPPIVLIHGFGAALDWWDAIAPDLASDHRVIRLDLIGHGGTEAPLHGFSIQRQAALVAAVLEQNGVDRVTVIGHSMGGEVATALAEAYPGRIERLILIDTPPSPGLTLNTISEIYKAPLIGPVLSHFDTPRLARRGLGQGFAPGFSVPDKFVADFLQIPYPAAVTAHGASIDYRTDRPVHRRLADLEPVPPLLVIFGALDAIVPPDKAALYEQVPDARVVTLEDVGHSPMVEAPDKTLELIRGFLRDDAATGAAPDTATGTE